MREAKCSGDQKFSTYTGRCGPPNTAPIPCGSYIPGSTATKSMKFYFVYSTEFVFCVLDHRNIGLFIAILLMMIFE
jgi:hypothetical protein